MFVLSVSERQVRVEQTELLVSDSINVYPVRFKFSKEWNGFSKTAVFRAGKTYIEVLLDDTAQCNIPYEVMLEHKFELLVGCYGMKGENLLLNTTWKSLGRIEEGAKNVDLHPQEPTPDVYQQLLSTMGNLENLETNDKSSLVNAINEVYNKVGTDGPIPYSGVPSGGTTGQMLVKASDMDYDTKWGNVPLAGTTDHQLLSNRDAEEQHPIEAISGLADELDRIPAPVEPLTNLELEELLK